MKKILALILALTMVFALTACGQTEAPAANPGTESAGTAPTTGGKKIVLTPASWQENSFWAKHIEIFAEYVNEHAANVSVNPVTPGSIVPTGETLQSVSDGVVPAMAIASAYAAGTIDVGYVFCTPPVVQNIQDMRELNEVYGAGKVWEDLLQSKYNVHVVGEMYGPADVPIVSTVPIKGVSDLKGVTIRVGAGSIADSLVALGAATDNAAATEVYTMLSTKAIDAAIMGSPSDDLASSYNEVTSYWIRYPYVNTTHCTTFIVNNDTWNEMTAEDQQVLIDAIEYSNKKIEEDGYATIQAAWDAVEAQGIELIRWSEEDARTWAQTFYDTCAAYSSSPEYTEYINILHQWAVDRGYLAE